MGCREPGFSMQMAASISGWRHYVPQIIIVYFTENTENCVQMQYSIYIQASDIQWIYPYHFSWVPVDFHDENRQNIEHLCTQVLGVSCRWPLYSRMRRESRFRGSEILCIIEYDKSLRSNHPFLPWFGITLSFQGRIHGCASAARMTATTGNVECVRIGWLKSVPAQPMWNSLKWDWPINGELCLRWQARLFLLDNGLRPVGIIWLGLVNIMWTEE